MKNNSSSFVSLDPGPTNSDTRRVEDQPSVEEFDEGCISILGFLNSTNLFICLYLSIRVCNYFMMAGSCFTSFSKLVADAEMDMRYSVFVPEVKDVLDNMEQVS